MPYERKGKCVYNKETGKKKGCSSFVGWDVTNPISP